MCFVQQGLRVAACVKMKKSQDFAGDYAMKMFFIAAAATALLCSPAHAAKREAVKLEIQTAGVNFADPQSVDEFRARATRKIADFCNPDDQIGATSPDRQCRRELTANLNRMVSNLAVASIRGAVQRN